jgi:uncharacterized membrane protein
MGCALEQPEAERQQCGSLAVGKEAEVTDAHEAAWQQVQKEATQELIDGRLMTRFLLRWAESRQRKLTLPSERATSLLLAMPTRWVYAPR